MTPRAQRLFLLFLLAATIAAAIYIFQKPMVAYMNALYLLPRPETFTELYLNDSLSLPTTPIQAGSVVNFSFTVHNVEGQAMTYPYLVYLVTSSGTTTVDSNTIALQNNEYATVSESYLFTAPYQTALFVIDLTQLGQEIHFVLPSRE